MNPIRIVRHGSWTAVLALLLTGCGTAAPPDQDPAARPDAGSATESSAVPPTGEITSPPAAEGSGPEKPQQGGGGGPAIPVASLPIGGAEEPPNRDPFCAGVSFLADLPAGVSVSVTSIRIEPAFFVLSASGCDRGPLCGDASFAFTGDAGGCFVPVQATGPAGETAQLILDGEVRCPAGQDEACGRFVGGAQHGSVPLQVPSLDEPAPPDTGSTSPAG
ncbi:MAG: hypothetical protein V7637_5161 [Mycobacteriales bacterium]|jgi:hypothetical protein